MYPPQSYSSFSEILKSRVCASEAVITRIFVVSLLYLFILCLKAPQDAQLGPGPGRAGVRRRDETHALRLAIDYEPSRSSS